MIIPVRCFTCGKVVADKWMEFERRCNKINKDAVNNTETSNDEKISREGIIMNDLGITRMCCRTVMLTTVDISHII